MAEEIKSYAEVDDLINENLKSGHYFNIYWPGLKVADSRYQLYAVEQLAKRRNEFKDWVSLRILDTVLPHYYTEKPRLYDAHEAMLQLVLSSGGVSLADRIERYGDRMCIGEYLNECSLNEVTAALVMTSVPLDKDLNLSERDKAIRNVIMRSLKTQAGQEMSAATDHKLAKSLIQHGKLNGTELLFVSLSCSIPLDKIIMPREVKGKGLRKLVNSQSLMMPRTRSRVPKSYGVIREHEKVMKTLENCGHSELGQKVHDLLTNGILDFVPTSLNDDLLMTVLNVDDGEIEVYNREYEYSIDRRLCDGCFDNFRASTNINFRIAPEIMRWLKTATHNSLLADNFEVYMDASGFNTLSFSALLVSQACKSEHEQKAVEYILHKLESFNDPEIRDRFIAYAMANAAYVLEDMLEHEFSTDIFVELIKQAPDSLKPALVATYVVNPRVRGHEYATLVKELSEEALEIYQYHVGNNFKTYVNDFVEVHKDSLVDAIDELYSLCKGKNDRQAFATEARVVKQIIEVHGINAFTPEDFSENYLRSLVENQCQLDLDEYDFIDLMEQVQRHMGLDDEAFRKILLDMDTANSFDVQRMMF